MKYSLYQTIFGRKMTLMSSAILIAICSLVSSVAAQGAPGPLNSLEDEQQPQRTIADFHPPLFWNRPPEGKYPILPDCM